ncbi:MAG: pitrilysin family protein [Burkholderiaceae bacterium]
MGLFSTQIQAALPIQRITLPSAAQVYVVSSMAIPMVDVQIEFDAGGRRDPAGMAGLASVTSGHLSKGVLAVPGRPALDENQLGEAWADLGATFGASAGDDRMSFSLRSLTYPDLLGKAVALAAQQLAAPAFPAALWLRDIERISASIKEANTKPATLAARRFNSAVYGSHPYGNELTEESLRRITASAMQGFYAAHVRACRAKISIVGAVSRENAAQIATQLLAGLPQEGCDALPTVAEVEPLVAAQDINVPFESAQAHVTIGQPGYKRSDPDFFALLVGNHILGGGGFTSRLTREVREKRGLSYSVYSYFSPGLHAGAFAIGLQTRPDQAAQAVQVSKDVLAQFVKDGPSQEELQAAKDNLIGGFALRIDSNRKLLDNVANIAWVNLPLDYLDNWTQRIDKITTTDIQAALQRKLQPEKMVTVVVGGAP